MVTGTPARARERGKGARVRRWLGRTALVLGSLLVGILVSEGLVRLFAPQPLVQIRPDIWMPVDGLGHQLAPNLDTTINTGEGPVRLLTDARGHRIGPHGPPSGEQKILAVGDSFLEALQVEYQDLVTTRLAELLQSRSSDRRPPGTAEPRYAVIGAGVSGWNPNHYYIKVRDELAEDDYDLVLVFVFVGNDVVSEARTRYEARAQRARPIRMPRSLRYRELVDAWIYPVYLQLRARSHLVVLLKGRFLNLWLRLGMSRNPLAPIYLTSHAESPSWTTTARTLKETADLATRSGSRAMVVLIPPDFAVDKSMGRNYAAGNGVDIDLVDLDQPARLLGRKLRDAGVAVIDPTDRFEALFESGVRLYGKVDRHLNRRGHDELARFILPAVAERLSTPSRVASNEAVSRP